MGERSSRARTPSPAKPSPNKRGTIKNEEQLKREKQREREKKAQQAAKAKVQSRKNERSTWWSIGR